MSASITVADKELTGAAAVVIPAPVSPPPETPATAGLVLPFVMRNWSRFVVVVFGTGVVAALMFAGVITAQGGIGLLGPLLGVGAVTAATPEPAAPAAPTAPVPPANAGTGGAAK